MDELANGSTGIMLDMNPDNNVYVRHLWDLIQTSSKINKVREIVKGLSRNLDGSGEPEKLVIVSVHPVAAYIVYLWLHKLGQGDVAFLP